MEGTIHCSVSPQAKGTFDVQPREKWAGKQSALVSERAQEARAWASCQGGQLTSSRTFMSTIESLRRGARQRFRAMCSRLYAHKDFWLAGGSLPGGCKQSACRVSRPPKKSWPW